jgi:hypothetical protein
MPESEPCAGLARVGRVHRREVNAAAGRIAAGRIDGTTATPRAIRCLDAVLRGLGA